MQKLLLLSIIVATVALPAWAARGRDVRRAVRKAIIAVLAFDAAYLFALRYIYPRL